MAGKKKLDAMVKFGLGVFVGSFLLIWGGMFLTRPDRSIPPYSIGSQKGTLVAMHVPPWTTEAGIEALLRRIRTVAHQSRDFGRMKIQPTTPDGPAGRYRAVHIYLFTLDAWAGPEMVHRYAQALASPGSDDDFRSTFEKAARGYYRLDGEKEIAWIGPVDEILRPLAQPSMTEHSRLLFNGTVNDAVQEQQP